MKNCLYIFICLALVSLTNQIIASTHHNGTCSGAPTIVSKYTILDLGPTDLSTSQLTRLEPLYTLAPSINNFGQVVYNKSSGGYVRDPNVGEYALGPETLPVYGHAINNHGDILVSINRRDDIEWMVWSQKSTLNAGPEGCKYHIANLNKQVRAFFCMINDKGTVTGYKEVGNKLRPFLWNRCTGLQPLGYRYHYDISGFPRGINKRGTVIGYFEEPTDSPPFIYNDCKGLEVLRNYRKLIDCCQGWIELADMVISQDGILYGTYVVKYVSSEADPNDLNQYFLYKWSPNTHEITTLKAKNMRIAAIDSGNTLAGSYKGHAAILREDHQPVDLNSLIEPQDPNWELLEATGINDMGRIVGYGKYKGEMHIFMLAPAF